MITKDDFILDPCKATPGFEFFPKKTKKIDLSLLLTKFKEKDYFIEKDSSPFLIIIKTKIGDVTIFSSMKVIIKGTDDEAKAKKLLDEILQIISSIEK
ncbi:MAG: hypothetical protein V1824_03675 [archaeon]